MTMRSHYAKQVTPELDGKEVKLAGWVHEIRDLGGLKFILLRDKTGLVQLTIKKKEADPALVAIVDKFVKEVAILCTGKVKASKIAPRGFEIMPSKIEVVGEVHGIVPFEVTGKVPADLDVRLDKRFIDLRRLETTAVFKIRSQAVRGFREKLDELEFQEITPTCLVSSSTEGGTDLFPVVYFDKEAFLAQSPQLYKQIAVMGGMDKVYMVTPVFRAEKHNTPFHLNEITQMDIEMGFATHEDAIGVLEQVFINILSRVTDTCQDELKLLGSNVTVPKEVPRFTYSQIVDKLNAKGYPMGWGEDFSKEQEKEMPALLGAEAFFITEWPTAIRAFYSMPHPDKPEICFAYDLMYKGVELCSGAQRIHQPDLLIKQLKAKGLRPSAFEGYIDAFRYGSIPHAGWSIGAERLTMKLANRDNIRECALFPRDRHRLTP
ncbi:MAG: aspartate--tRNA(Asn) ligase [Candidatus Micrarchaeia archaeon]